MYLKKRPNKFFYLLTLLVFLAQLAQPTAARDVVAQGDPIWCPSTIFTPTSGSFGCSTNDGKLQTALTFADTQTTDGVIWIQAAPSDTSAISINSLNTYALTLQGGWVGGANTTVSGVSTFNVPISIIWAGNLTLKDITYNGTGDTSGADNGLTIRSLGNVALNNVQVLNSPSEGASISCTGGSCGVANSLVITDSKFNGNSYRGAIINNFKNVTLTNVQASNNGLSGADLGSNTDTGGSFTDTGNYTITGGTFSNNGGQTYHTWTSGDGLNVKTKGNISIDGITANGNSINGASLNTYNDDKSSTGTVTVKNSTFGLAPSIFSDPSSNKDADPSKWGNGLYGLQISSGGLASLDTITANYNGSAWAVDNANGGGYGIDVNNFVTGGVDLAKVTANYNYRYGAHLLSPYDLDVASSTFNHNGRYGAFTDGGANLNLTTVDANYNGYAGFYLTALDVQSLGYKFNPSGGVFLSKVTAHDNGLPSSYAGIEPYKVSVIFYCTSVSSYDNGKVDVGYTCIEVPSGGEPGGGSVTPPSGSDDLKNDPSYPENHGASIKNVEVSGGQNFDLSCGGDTSGYNLSLAGNQVSLPCGSLSGDGEGTGASLTLQPGAQLPAAVDSQFAYVVAMEVKLSAPLKGDMLVSFALPVGANASNFTILFWDGSKWIDLGGFESGNGLFNVKTTQGGIYVLVSK
ncbi:MAG: hypothetical protein NT121_03735 [Chloroflexi bacterium]|nr:hypothetical protein [Chloroflexota bacterium]